MKTTLHRIFQNPLFLFSMVILTAGSIIRIYFLNGPLFSDDTYYMWVAKNLLSIDIVNHATHFLFRIGLVWPLALLQKIFGYNLTSYYAFSFTFNILLLLAIILISYRLFDLRLAILAGSFSVFFFYFIKQGINVLPDIPQAVYFLFSFYLFTFIEGKSPPKRLALLIGAACLGFAGFTMKRTGAVFLIVIPAYEFLHKKNIRSTISYSLIFSSLILLEIFSYWIISGDPFLHFRQEFVAVQNWSPYVATVSWQNYLFRYFDYIWKTYSGKISIIGIIAGTLIAVLKKDLRVIPFALGGLLSFLVYAYSTTSFSPLIPALPANGRYIILPFVGSIIFLAYSFVALYNLFLKWGKNHQKFMVFCYSIFWIWLLGIEAFDLGNLPSDSLLWNNRMWNMDHNLRSYISANLLTVPIYSPDAKDFYLFPGFSSLNIESLDNNFDWYPLITAIQKGKTAEPFRPGYYLYSIDRVQRNLLSLWQFGNREEYDLMSKLITYNPNWDYIIKTEDIVFVYIPSVDYNCTKIGDLNQGAKNNKWNILVYNNKEITKAINPNDGSIKINNPAKENPGLSINACMSTMKLKDRCGILSFVLNPDKIYRLDLSYSLEQKMEYIYLDIIQTSQGKNKQQTQKLASVKGNYNYHFYLTSTEASERMLIRVRTINPASYSLSIQQISLNQCQ